MPNDRGTWVSNYKLVIEAAMARILFKRYGIRLRWLEMSYSVDRFANIVSGMVRREPGRTGMGGGRYFTLMVDIDILNRHERLHQMCADSCKSIWYSFKMDRVNRIWGVK